MSEASRSEIGGVQTGAGVLMTGKYISVLKSRSDKDWRKVHVEPLNLVKGKLLVSIYSLEHIPHECLEDLISEGKLTFGEAILDAPKKIDKRYRILILNQRRQSSEAADGVPDLTASCKKEAKAAEKLNNLIPIHFDLIVWGNDKKCEDIAEQIRLHGEPSLSIQPGAVTATRYTDSQSLPKYMSFVEISLTSPILVEYYRLKSVRQMVLGSIEIEEPLIFDHQPSAQLEIPYEEKHVIQVKEKLREMVETARVGTIIFT